MTAESSPADERPVPAGAPRPRPDVALYVISVAADLAGLHPQTLRLYERKGLLDPARSRGGKRRYSEADMDRLRRIGQLTAAGVSLEGVRRILSLEREVAVLRKEVERWRARAS
ncbi:MAG TPA: MerR family transcriptional regulator [Acidimicrobiales bacterium]|nr:MerR family transcriptional regulator [Acidimicrobiales bacterium]